LILLVQELFSAASVCNDGEELMNLGWQICDIRQRERTQAVGSGHGSGAVPWE